jgi:hypothetical protein
MSKSDYEDRVQAIRRAEYEGSFPIPEFEQNPREALEFFRQAALDRRDEVKYDVIKHVIAYTFPEPVTMAVMITAFARIHSSDLLYQSGQTILVEWQCNPSRDYRGYPLLVLDLLKLFKKDLRKIVDDQGQTLGEFLISPSMFRQVFEVLVSEEDFGKKVLYAAAEQLTESSDTDSIEHLEIIKQLLEKHKDPKVRAIFESYYAWAATRDPMGDFLAEIEAKARAKGLSENQVKAKLTRATKAYKAMFGAYNLVKRDIDSQNDLPDEDDD